MLPNSSSTSSTTWMLCPAGPGVPALAMPPLSLQLCAESSGVIPVMQWEGGSAALLSQPIPTLQWLCNDNGSKHSLKML